MVNASLSVGEGALLRLVREADEDRGGLSWSELAPEDHAAIERLCALGLVEVRGEYGEAPDGEEDEREAGDSACVYRITGEGVEALRELPDGRDGRFPVTR